MSADQFALQYLEEEVRRLLLAERSRSRGREGEPHRAGRSDTGLLKARARALAGAALRQHLGGPGDHIAAAVAAKVVDEMLGFGPVEPFLEDPSVSEIMINGPSEVWIERRGRIEGTDAKFKGPEQLHSFIERVIGPLGLRIDDSCPIVDARLPDGSRFHAVLEAVARKGPIVTIRKFQRVRYSLDDLVHLGSLSDEAAKLLTEAVKRRANIVISGGTSTGKTTLLNVLSALIPPGERIITVEDAAELQLQQDHVVSLEARPPNSDGAGEVTLGDLVRAALRMRPDRIILGEARGAEALFMLQAMNTGHEGSLATVHANSPVDAFFRIETMTLMANVGLSVEAVRLQIGSAIDAVVQMARAEGGRRIVTQISCVDENRGWPHLVALFESESLAKDGARSCDKSRLVEVADRDVLARRLARRSVAVGHLHPHRETSRGEDDLLIEEKAVS